MTRAFAPRRAYLRTPSTVGVAFGAFPIAPIAAAIAFVPLRASLGPACAPWTPWVNATLAIAEVVAVVLAFAGTRAARETRVAASVDRVGLRLDGVLAIPRRSVVGVSVERVIEHGRALHVATIDAVGRTPMALRLPARHDAEALAEAISPRATPTGRVATGARTPASDLRFSRFARGERDVDAWIAELDAIAAARSCGAGYRGADGPDDPWDALLSYSRFPTSVAARPATHARNALLAPDAVVGAAYVLARSGAASRARVAELVAVTARDARRAIGAGLAAAVAGDPAARRRAMSGGAAQRS